MRTSSSPATEKRASNAAGIVSGIPPGEGLTDAGRHDARLLGVALERTPIDLGVATEFLRTKETLALALVGRDVPHVVLPQLERDPVRRLRRRAAHGVPRVGVVGGAGRARRPAAARAAPRSRPASPTGSRRCCPATRTRSSPSATRCPSATCSTPPTAGSRLPGSTTSSTPRSTGSMQTRCSVRSRPCGCGRRSRRFATSRRRPDADDPPVSAQETAADSR